ncbi:ABC transporter permease subunit, partial [Pseudomonas syringae]|uniref:ABC transporter permease subunit n=1 Tax=Pseudomonas syringae TaxID=317 RepID=UPI001F19B4DC
MSTLTLNTSSTLVKVLPRLLPAVLPLLVLIILLFFAINAPGFLSWGNLSSLVLNNFVLLAIVAIGMTWAVAVGGIDLSVGTALDFASLGFVVALNAGHGLGAAIAIALLAGVAAGVFNALLIAGLRISPFLATLGTLFIGTSVQQLLSDGGQPIYIAQSVLPGITGVSILGVPLPLVVVLLLAGVLGVVLGRGGLGGGNFAGGTQPQLAYYPGLFPRRLPSLGFFGRALGRLGAGIVVSS